ncbi:uncharacterized protein COLE_00153 [Cutaneotrichosporon oleaginosum]|nr:hypothetical protein COLE_00153 [Cutaneotrichosporon oleaginosum]
MFIRDDAAQRSLHEGGEKHKGNLERFIRNLYKGGERAKREKEAEKRQFERIEAAARSAHSSVDGARGAYGGRPMLDRPMPSASKPRRDKPSGDKWANYTTAAQMGLADEEGPSAYEIEQMVRGRGTKVGQWEEVVSTPTPPPPPEDKRPETEEEELASFKIQHKRPHRDVYDDEDVDTGALLGLKLKTKERKMAEGDVKGEIAAEDREGAKEEAKGTNIGAGFSKGGWGTAETKAEVKTDADGLGVKIEPSANADSDAGAVMDIKTEPGEDRKPNLDASVENPAAVECSTQIPAPPTSGGSMFKKRRPPPSSRKK